MDNDSLLKRFRLGFKKVKDTKTGIDYIATGKLEVKIWWLNAISLGMGLLSAVFLLSGIIKSLPLQLAIILLYFILATIGMKWIGKRMISEQDLVNVREKSTPKK
jgi:hypothetical protein